MAEGTYEYECMRAELLGVAKPDYNDWLEKQKERQEVVEEEQETENLKELDHEGEGLKNVSGGLDELTSILQVTQKKINKFKASCSSLTGFLKVKLSATTNPESVKTESETVQPVESQSESPRKSDLTKALDNHVDNLDAMIEKAENAHYSMAQQTKEMKRFTN